MNTRILPGGAPRARRPLAPVRLVTLASALLAAGCDLGPKQEVQTGYRGTGMEVVYNMDKVAKQVAATDIPAPLPPASPSPPGPLPWRNVQVLNDISVGEFNRTMIAFTTWIAGTGNCAYCHNVANFASDTANDGKPLYTKLTARRMILMTRHINGQYQQHVANTGVTCYTCHAGKPVPRGVWFYGKETDYLRHYLDRDGARVITQHVEPSNENRSSVKQTEWTYALMISQSKALGVNCAYCHNTRQFSSWDQAPPQRVKAFHGIKMMRDINTNYVAPLQLVLPGSRLGPKGDGPKAQCITCHNGAYKPLFGAQMAKSYPAIWGRPMWDTIPFPAYTPAQDTTKKGAAKAATASAGATPKAVVLGPAPPRQGTGQQ